MSLKLNHELEVAKLNYMEKRMGLSPRRVGVIGGLALSTAIFIGGYRSGTSDSRSEMVDARDRVGALEDLTRQVVTEVEDLSLVDNLLELSEPPKQADLDLMGAITINDFDTAKDILGEELIQADSTLSDATKDFNSDRKTGRLLALIVPAGAYAAGRLNEDRFERKVAKTIEDPKD